MTVLGYALAGAMLAFSQSASQPFVTAAQCGASPICQAQQQLGALILFGLPAVVFGAVVARLSSTRRDKHLARLRLLGVSAHQVRTAVMAETLLLATVGGIVGILLTTVAAPVAPSILAPYLHANATTVLSAFALLVVTVATASFVGTLRVAASPFTVSAATAYDKPRLRRTLPFVVGLALLTVAIVVDAPDPMSQPLSAAAWRVAWIGGLIASAVGLSFALPLATYWVGSRLATHGPRPWLRLAGRGLQHQASAVTRLAAVFCSTLAAASMLLILVSFAMASPDVTAAIRAETTGPNYALLTASSHRDAQTITKDPAVLTATTLFQAECTDAQGDYCGQAFVATCAELAELAGTTLGALSRCRDDQVSTIATTGARTQPNSPPGDLRFVYDWPEPGEFPAPPASGVVQVDPALHSAVDEFGPTWLIPPTLATGSIDTSLRYFLRLKPGLDHVEDLRQRFPNSPIDTLTGGPETYHTAMQTKLILQLATVLAAATAIAGILLVLIDDSRRRADIFARLAAMGIPTRTIRSAAAVQYAIPVLLGTPVAALLGIVSLYAYIGGTTPSDNFGTAPTTIAIQTALLGCSAAVLCASFSAYTVGRGHRGRPNA